MLGINIGLDELLLADRLRSKGAKIDAVIAHHTNGIGVAISLVHDFMPVAIDFLVGEGVPRADAAACINRFIQEKEQALEDTARMGPDMAKLLGFPLACIHTPADYYIGRGCASGSGSGATADGRRRGARPDGNSRGAKRRAHRR